MLKRHQILLFDWLGSYIKFISKKYKISSSEFIRAALCVYIAQTIARVYSTKKFGASEKERIQAIKKVLEGKTTEEETHKFIAASYFEARKAIEFRMRREKKKITR